MARLLLGDEAIGAHEPVAVEGLAVAEADNVHHAVAVERVVDLSGGMDRVLGVPQIDTVQVGRQLTDHLKVVGLPLDLLRPPRAGAVGVIVVGGEGRQRPPQDLDVHGSTSHCRVRAGVPHPSGSAPMTKLALVVVLPPMFKVATVFAPATW